MKKAIWVLLLFAGIPHLLGQELLLRWDLDDLKEARTKESVSGAFDVLRGYFDPVPGVKSGAVQFDGFTSSISRDKSGVELPRAFSVNAWVYLESYPWFRCPVLDIRANDKEGLVFGVNQRGELCAGLGLPNDWTEFAGPRLPLRRWTMVTLTVDAPGGSGLWIDGEPVARTALTPVLRSTRDNRLSIGRNAILEDWWDYQYTVKDHYSFWDGRIDELGVYDGALSGDRIKALWESAQPLPRVTSPPRILPAGPPGRSEFGAVYTRLDYTKQWDRLWRTGDLSDVLVRFADHDGRLVFWRGTGFVPCWVTGNGIWYTNEWTETWGNDVSSCAEPLMDRDCRFSHVRIIENSPARTVVQWRYALVDADYKFVARDVDGRGEWTEESYVIYPDAVGIRKIDLFYSKPLRDHDWEEAIVLLSPGQHPDDVIEDPEVTLLNMRGESRDYSWRTDLPLEMKEPAGANIHVVNLKSRLKPFYIVDPGPFETKEGKYEAPYFRSYAASMAKGWRPDPVPSIYGWWDHWPVTPVPGDGRWVVTNDKPSHFNLTTYTQWKDHALDDRVKSRIMLHGLAEGDPGALVALAKSWLQPPALKTASADARYDPAQRAYVVAGHRPGSFQGEFLADPEHPAWHPAIVLEGRRLDHPAIALNGRMLAEGRNFRSGVALTDRGYRTVIWINEILEERTRLTIR
jgi:hypothetical protein